MSIRLSAVSYSISGKPILNSVDAIFQRGQLTCVLGPNGAGKTTLLKTVTGEVSPDVGNVLIDDVASEQSQSIAFAPQSSTPPGDLTVSEMVRLGRFDPRKRWWSGLTDDDRRLIDESMATAGIGHMAQRKVSSLSGGELQRAWIAFCLVQQKPYLLLDESLSAIDFLSRWDYFNLITKAARNGAGVVLVTHDLAMVAEFADSVLLLDHGTVWYSGPTGDGMSEALDRMRDPGSRPARPGAVQGACITLPNHPGQTVRQGTLHALVHVSACRRRQ